MNLLYANNISTTAGFARSSQVRCNALAFKYHLNSKYSEVLIKPLKLGNREFRLKESSLLRKAIFFCQVLYLITKCDWVYSRNLWLLVVLGVLTRKQLSWEMHDAPSRESLLKVVPKRLNIICISQALESWLTGKGYCFKTMVAHDGISIKLWEKYSRITKNSHERMTVIHTGSAFPGRGLEILFELAKENPDIDFHHFGGTEMQIDYWKKKYIFSPNAKLFPAVSKEEVMRVQRNADILLLPMTKKSPIWWCTSPMKLFEYMASETLIVHTGIGSITEVLSDENSVKIDINNLARYFRTIIMDYENLISRGTKARQDVYNNYLWEIRTKKILDFLNIPTN